MAPARKIAVIGGGMAGLAAAYELAKLRREGAPVEAILFEASSRLGGTVETVREEGFVLECGPDGWVTEKPWARDLAIELGLESELIPSNDSQRRTYLLQDGRLQAMPDGLRMMVPSNWAPLLGSPLLSAQAKLAYLREPKRAAELKAWAAAHPEDESVSSLVRRHFGDEVADTLAAPLLSGVFGGDIGKLSAHAVMAPFVAMEREHGSLMAAVQQRARAAIGRSSVFTSLRGGVGALIDAMVETLPAASVRLNHSIAAVERSGDRWVVRGRAHAAAGRAGVEREDCFDALLLATPAHVAGELLRPLDPRSAEILTMDASSAIIVCLGFAPEHAKAMRWPRGFGFLAVPRTATASSNPGRARQPANALLAATFLDQKFDHRVPPGGKLLRAFFGGRQALALMGESDAALIARARRDLRQALGPLPEAAVAIVRRWPRSLPQYEVGHLDRMAELDGRIAAIPRMQLIGNAYRGVGLPDLVREGRRAARQTASQQGE